MARIFLAFVLLPLLAIPTHAAPVQTTSGLLEGLREGNVAVYKGIPYAAPPVGALRWREPQPAPLWSGIRAAKEFAPACMQTGVSMPGEAPPEVSEDCLYLNIWVPQHRASTHLPVLVWIHGGGFFNGSAAMPLYWGDRLAQKGLIVVTLAYRLGPLGFLAHPALTAESPHHSSGNYGLLDQIAALRWVQNNIAAFGGDRGKVTVAGQSAGATSVSILMASPLGKGLFQRAIAQSGGVFEPLQLAPNYQLAAAETQGVAYMTSLGVHSIEVLRALDARDLFKGTNSISHPVIDPYVLPQSPYDVFAAGRQNDVPILIGSNAAEARSLVQDLERVTSATFASEIIQHWGTIPDALLTPYPHATDIEAHQARLDFERDLRFGWDGWAWARLQALTGHGAVFYYYFTHNPPFPKDSIYADWGASHYAELWYMFGHLGQQHWRWSASDRKLSDDMMTYWSNFARSGNPNGDDLALWPKFTTSNPEVMYLDDPNRSGPVANLPSLNVFDQVYDQVRGTKFGTKMPPL